MYIRKKKKLILVIGTRVVCSIFLMPHVYATNNAELACATPMSDLANMFYVIESLFSWIWILFANLVGKLMTNSFVYGEAINLDVFLWKIWQISRNIANFAIGFFFLYTILKYVLYPDEAKTPTKIIKDMMISGVLVQMSWFLVMVVMDISTVLFAMVSSFPSQVVGSDLVVSNALKSSINSCDMTNTQGVAPYGNVLCKREKNIVVFKNAPDKGDLLDSLSNMITLEDKAVQGLTQERLIDHLLPKADSLSGPLMFLGFEIFKTAQLSEYRSTTGNSCIDTTFKQFIQIMLHSGMMLLYTFSLIVLTVVLFARVLYLWVFIALSPIAVVLYYLKIFKLPTELEFMNLEKIGKLIFQPVYYAFYISLMMIVLVVINWGLKGHLSNPDTPLKINTTATSSTMTLNDGLLSIGFQNTTMGIYDVLLGVIGLIFMRILVKTAITQQLGIKRIDDLTKSAAKMAQSVINTTPIIPVPGKNTAVGLKAVYDAENDTMPVLDKQYDEKIAQYTRIGENQMNSVRGIFGLEAQPNSLSELDKKSLKTLAETSDSEVIKKFKEKIEAIRKNNTELNFRDLEDSLYALLTNTNATVQSYWTTIGIKPINLKKENFIAFLNTNKHLQTIYEKLFGVEVIDSLGNNQENAVKYRLPPLKK